MRVCVCGLKQPHKKKITIIMLNRTVCLYRCLFRQNQNCINILAIIAKQIFPLIFYLPHGNCDTVIGASLSEPHSSVYYTEFRNGACLRAYGIELFGWTTIVICFWGGGRPVCTCSPKIATGKENRKEEKRLTKASETTRAGQGTPSSSQS